MSFAISFKVQSGRPYPTFKHAHLIEHDGTNVTTLMRKLVNQAIHELYKTVNPKVEKQYYGFVTLTGRDNRPFDAFLTEDKRVQAYFVKESQ